MDRPLTLVLLTGLLLGGTVGCDLFGTDGGEDGGGTALPEGPAVAASMEGGDDNSALWVFDAETLERTAVIETENKVPDGVAFSPDYERWYVTWDTCCNDEDTRKVRSILDPTSGEITRRVATSDLSVGNGQLFYEPITDHVVANGDGADFFDPKTLELESTPFDGGGRAVVADKRETLYFVSGTKEISVYDPVAGNLTNTIQLPTTLYLTDIGLSPDERYLYATAWGGATTGSGQFYAVDLETGETIFEGGPVGKSANLAVAPNGRSVYIDSPAGGLGSLATGTGKVYRFDVEARELEVFLDWTCCDGPPELTGGHGLIADKITMLPSGEAFIMYNRAALLDYRSEEVGEPAPPLLKIDAETGEVLATYTLPRKENGTPRATIRQLHFGVVPE
jgi:sugar lactone lactonase YvrE